MRYARHFGRRTKIVCTIGPATGSDTAVEQLIKAGMDVARLNLAHGSYGEHSGYIDATRKAAQRLSIPVAIVMDLPGPKYRTGAMRADSVVLKRGAQLTLTTRQLKGNESVVPVKYPSFHRDVEVGGTVLLGDGAIELRVQSIRDSEVKCKVVIGGVLTAGRGIVIPGMRPAGPFVTSRLREHIDFAIRQKADYVAISFVSRPEDVEETRAALRQAGRDIPIIAKIERRQAVTNFDRILAASDGIMVARGDLGLDIPLEQVPLAQKEIIRKSNEAGKPVITATQMLESMVNSPRPTRAEVTDVANAIFDGTDAVMLSAETSIGKYPLAAARMMGRVARATERRLPYEALLTQKAAWPKLETGEMISYDACHTAHRLGAVAIVAFTQSGSTARRVSKYRPKVPILAITPNGTVFGGLVLCWGVQPVEIAGPASVDELFALGARVSKELGLAKPGDLIVITGGIPLGMSGTTNLLKVHKIE